MVLKKGRETMTLQQQALTTVQMLPEEKVPILIAFASFLNQTNVTDALSRQPTSSLSERRCALSGILKGQIWMAEDFNETPECFKEYV